jgi:hypothetical protein
MSNHSASKSLKSPHTLVARVVAAEIATAAIPALLHTDAGTISSTLDRQHNQLPTVGSV